MFTGAHVHVSVEYILEYQTSGWPMSPPVLALKVPRPGKFPWSWANWDGGLPNIKPREWKWVKKYAYFQC